MPPLASCIAKPSSNVLGATVTTPSTITCEPMACARAVAIGDAGRRSRSAAAHPAIAMAATRHTARRAQGDRSRRAMRARGGRRRIGRDTAPLLTAVSTRLRVLRDRSAGPARREHWTRAGPLPRDILHCWFVPQDRSVAHCPPELLDDLTDLLDEVRSWTGV